jgi:leucyl-tRNA synthetase
MVFAGAPEDDIDWADVSPTGAVKWLARVWRLAGDVDQASAGADPANGDGPVRRAVHRLIAEATWLMEARRLNVTVARLMELTSLLRKALDTGPGAGDPAIREGTEALARMLSCFAPFTAGEAWQRLGRAASVCDYGWPEADAALAAAETVTCVVQVDRKLRDRIEVPASATAQTLRELAIASANVRQALHGAQVADLIVKPPGLVNVVSRRTGDGTPAA